MKFNPHPEKRASGLSWLGEIPAHWELVPSNWLFCEGIERARADDQHLSATQKYGVIPLAEFERLESRRVTHAFKNLEQRKHVEADDFVISMRSFEGGIERVMAQGCVRSSYVVLHASPAVHVGFFSYLLKSSAYIQGLQSTATFVRDGQDLNYSNFRKLKLPRLDISEQRKIANCLDRATSRIDTLIAKKTRFIELLREKRQALITHAVTKGLDAGVVMTDSRAEWLAKIPAKWDVAPLRVFLTLRRDIVGAASATTKLLSLTTQGVIERNLENPTGKMPASFDTYQRVSPGDMIFCLFDMDETPRTVGISQQDGMVTGAYTVFRPSSDLWARFLYYFFLHVDEYKRLRPFYKGLRKTIRSGAFLSIPVPRPPERVAIEIVSHLDRAGSRIDALVARTQGSIELLREHRTALITAAVTGKIDVRDVAEAAV